MSLSSPQTSLRFKIDVVLPRPVPGVFSYVLQGHQAAPISPGCLVRVPLATSETYAVVVDCQPLESSLEDVSYREIIDVLDDEPLLSSQLLNLTRFVADYYLSQWGWVIRTALPPAISPTEIKLISLTDQGKSLYERGKLAIEGLNQGHYAVLETLAKKGRPIPFKLLSNAMGRGAFPIGRILRELKSRGFISYSYSISKGEKKAGKPRYFKVSMESRLAKAAVERNRKKAPKKASVMSMLLDISNQFPVFTSRDVNRSIVGASRYFSTLVKEGFISPVETVERVTSRFITPGANGKERELTTEQSECLAQIFHKNTPEFTVFLLHGITSSGKTEVYLQAAEKVMKQGRDALVLVPEIGLTPAMIGHIRQRFGEKAALLHSGLDPSERYTQWQRIHNRQAKIVVGTRSAVFAPLANLGLIVVDEEHDTSFKQTTNPCYNARDVAVVRASYANCPIILGSATPSMESYTNALSGKYKLLEMNRRIDDRPLPKVEIIDMRKVRKKLQKEKESKKTFQAMTLSPQLVSSIERCLGAGEQVILFIPRRGFSHFLICHECGYIPKCRRCSVSLTYHRVGEMLKCHYCNEMVPLITRCPECQSVSVRGFGVGSQRVAEEVRHYFPHARVARVDTDSISGRNIHKVLADLGRGAVDVLIGTQMVTKGHDFHNITLVGVLATESTLFLPDFRAAERTFQLITQVAGRTGRGHKRGVVLLQTFTPEHHAISCASRHDYTSFYKKEIRVRRSFTFPPYRRLANLILSGKDQQNLIRRARQLRSYLSAQGKDVEILGPAPAPLSRIKEHYRWHFVLKARNSTALHSYLSGVMKEMRKKVTLRGLDIQLDIDPIFLM